MRTAARCGRPTMPTVAPPCTSSCRRMGTEQAPSDSPSTVFVIDDDPDVLQALARLLISSGRTVKTFSSPQRFLEVCDHVRGCIVLDLEMPGLNGLELQQTLEARASVLPVVFLTGQGNVSSSVQAMKRGAV